MSSRRSRRCRAPSKNNKEFGPTNASNARFARPARNRPGSPARICLMAPGSVKNTIAGKPDRRTVNVSPYRSAQVCMKGSGANTHLNNWTGVGVRGPCGSFDVGRLSSPIIANPSFLMHECRRVSQASTVSTAASWPSFSSLSLTAASLRPAPPRRASARGRGLPRVCQSRTPSGTSGSLRSHETRAVNSTPLRIAPAMPTPT